MRSQARSFWLSCGNVQGRSQTSYNSSVCVRWARSMWPLSFGERGGRTKSRMPRRWHSVSNWAWNSDRRPPASLVPGRAYGRCDRGRRTATVFQAGDVARPVAAQPAVEGLGADVELATGPPSVPPVSLVIVHPYQATPGRWAEFASAACQAQSTGRCSIGIVRITTPFEACRPAGGCLKCF